eukprot:297223-Pleurochrysis_carterae.AAC.3
MLVLEATARRARDDKYPQGKIGMHSLCHKFLKCLDGCYCPYIPHLLISFGKTKLCMMTVLESLYVQRSSRVKAEVAAQGSENEAGKLRAEDGSEAGA